MSLKWSRSIIRTATDSPERSNRASSLSARLKNSARLPKPVSASRMAWVWRAAARTAERRTASTGMASSGSIQPLNWARTAATPLSPTSTAEVSILKARSSRSISITGSPVSSATTMATRPLLMIRKMKPASSVGTRSSALNAVYGAMKLCPVSWQKTSRAAAIEIEYCAKLKAILTGLRLVRMSSMKTAAVCARSSSGKGPVATSATAKVVDIVTIEASSSPRETGIGPSSPRITPATSSHAADGDADEELRHVQAAQRERGDDQADPSHPSHEQAEGGGDGEHPAGARPGGAGPSDPLVTGGLRHVADLTVGGQHRHHHHFEPAPSTETRAINGATPAVHRVTVATAFFRTIYLPKERTDPTGSDC